MKIKVSEAKDQVLDYLVAKCEGRGFVFGETDYTDGHTYQRGTAQATGPHYSTDWSQGGPIIEREELSVEPLYTAGGLDCWQAFGHNLRYDDHGNYIQGSDNRQYGPTPLIAAMRCYVASKLGDDVEVPEELVCQ